MRVRLRLRDIGGIIVVDFIDMHTDNHKREIMNSLQQALKGDKMHPKVQDITVLNLVEITRKNRVRIYQAYYILPARYATAADVCKAERIFLWKLSVACVPC